MVVGEEDGSNMLSKYGMIGCKPIFVPLEQNVKLSAEEGELLEDVTMYRRIVGSLIYMTITTPDLSYAVGLVSQGSHIWMRLGEY